MKKNYHFISRALLILQILNILFSHVLPLSSTVTEEERFVFKNKNIVTLFEKTWKKYLPISEATELSSPCLSKKSSSQEGKKYKNDRKQKQKYVESKTILRSNKNYSLRLN